MQTYFKKIWLLLPVSLVMMLTYQNCDLTRNITPDNAKYLDTNNIQSFTRTLSSGYIPAGFVKNYSVKVILGAPVQIQYNFDDQHNHCSDTISLSDSHRALLENVLDYIRYKEMPASEMVLADGATQKVSFEMLEDTLFVYDQLYSIGQPMNVFTQGRDELMLFLKNEVLAKDTHLCPSDFAILFN